MYNTANYPYTNSIGKVSCCENSVLRIDHRDYVHFCTVYADSMSLDNLARLLELSGFAQSESTNEPNTYYFNHFRNSLTIRYQ